MRVSQKADYLLAWSYGKTHGQIDFYSPKWVICKNPMKHNNEANSKSPLGPNCCNYAH